MTTTWNVTPTIRALDLAMCGDDARRMKRDNFEIGNTSRRPSEDQLDEILALAQAQALDDSADFLPWGPVDRVVREDYAENAEDVESLVVVPEHETIVLYKHDEETGDEIYYREVECRCDSCCTHYELEEDNGLPTAHGMVKYAQVAWTNPRPGLLLHVAAARKDRELPMPEVVGSVVRLQDHRDGSLRPRHPVVARPKGPAQQAPRRFTYDCQLRLAPDCQGQVVVKKQLDPSRGILCGQCRIARAEKAKAEAEAAAYTAANGG